LAVRFHQSGLRLCRALPEPSTATILGLGLAGCAVARRKRQA
jgi:hypothetical protein